jgi:malate dehydrogenase (oxaloacetate-decarboxylating)
VPQVNLEVAIAVAEQAIEEESAGVSWGKDEVRKKAEEARWEPEYQGFVYDEGGEA